MSYKLTTFENGLRFVSVPMETSDSITVYVLVGTGSRYESKDINGISHFLEHMMFKGTAKRPGAMDIAHELDAIGADCNAFTSKEYTGYYVKVASDKLEMALDVISDIFQNSKIDPDEVQKERGVIIEEINMYRDEPRRYIGDLFEELLYGDQPLGWEVAGQKEVVLSVPRDKFVEYFDTHYFAANTVIAVAGKYDESQIEDKVRKYFSNIREHEPITALPVVEKQDKPAIKLQQKTTDQSHFIIGVRAYNRFDERRHALGILSIILGAGMSSRLFTEVREKRGLAYYVAASADSYADVGYMCAFAGVDNTRLIPALEVIMNEFRKLTQESVTDKELQKAKSFLHGKMAIGLETSDSLASFYADQELLRNEILTPQQKLEKLDKVTVEDILEVAQDIFKTERLNLALIGPAADEAAIYNLLKM